PDVPLDRPVPLGGGGRDPAPFGKLDSVADPPVAAVDLLGEEEGSDVVLVAGFVDAVVERLIESHGDRLIRPDVPAPAGLVFQEQGGGWPGGKGGRAEGESPIDDGALDVRMAPRCVEVVGDLERVFSQGPDRALTGQIEFGD